MVHAAAIVSETGRMADFVRVNTRGTRNVLDATAGRPHGRASRRWPAGATSSGAPLRRGRAAAALRLPYIDTKGATETLALRRGATVIRPGDVYGAGSQPWVVRPLEMMRAGRFFLPAPGRRPDHAVYVDDLVDAVVRALREPRAAGRAYTVWDGAAVTAREFFAHHARTLGRDRVPVLPAPLLRLAAPRRRGPGGGHVHAAPRRLPEHARTRGARLAAARGAR